MKTSHTLFEMGKDAGISSMSDSENEVLVFLFESAFGGDAGVFITLRIFLGTSNTLNCHYKIKNKLHLNKPSLKLPLVFAALVSAASLTFLQGNL